jgi:hypothetical protein
MRVLILGPDHPGGSLPPDLDALAAGGPRRARERIHDHRVFSVTVKTPGDHEPGRRLRRGAGPLGPAGCPGAAAGTRPGISRGAAGTRPGISRGAAGRFSGGWPARGTAGGAWSAGRTSA